MAETVYIADVELDRTGFVIVINGIPAEHALSTHRVRLPINEYVQRGANRIAIEAASTGSNAPTDSPGRISVRILEEDVDGERIVRSTPLVEDATEFDAFPQPFQTVHAANFRSEIGNAPDLAGFAPIGAPELEIIDRRLEAIVAALREGNAERLSSELAPYFARYEAAYDHVAAGTMRTEFASMVAAFRNVGARFSLEARLRTLPGGLLVDCLGPKGAAIRGTAPGMPPYDLWLVMGVCQGQAVVVF